jgi:hypothetical protein
VKKTTLLLTILTLCAGAWAAGNAAVAPRTIASRKPAITGGAEAVTIPHLLSYQGQIADTAGRPVPNGVCAVTFSIYDSATGGTQCWTELQNVTTKNGLFTCLLGSVTPLDYLPQEGGCWLEMQVHPDPAMTPRIRIASAAYAFVADVANTADSARPNGYAYGDLTGYYPSPTIGTGKVNSDKVQDNSLRGVDFKTPCSLYCQSGNPGAALWIKSSNTGNGIRVDSAANNGIVVYYSNGAGVLIDSTAGNGISVYGVATDGIYIANAGVRGVRVDNAGSFGVASYGNSGGGFFKADVASGVGLEADAYNNVATDTAIHAHGKGIASGGWSTGFKDGSEAPCVVSAERMIIASGSARLTGGKATLSFPRVFADNIRTDIPVQVTLTPVGNPAGMFCVTARDAHGFSASLKAVSGWSGETDVAFDWIAIGTLREPETAAEAKAEQEKEDQERAAARLRLVHERQE